MRAGYTTVALAVIGSVGLGAVVTSAITPRPTTVRAALGLDGADAPDLDARRTIAVERRVAACMAGSGYAYVPAPPAAATLPDAHLDPVAWADRWGFGVTTSGPATRETEPAPDANRALAARLGPLGEARYRAALDGPDGCREAAIDEIIGLRTRLLAPLAGAFEALEAAVESDPAMTAVRAAWRTCVERAADIIGIPGTLRTRERLVPTGLELLARRRAALPEGDAPAHDRLRASERRAAGLVARCEAAYAGARATVAGPHEAAVVRAHGPALRRIGAAIRAAEAALPALPAP